MRAFFFSLVSGLLSVSVPACGGVNGQPVLKPGGECRWRSLAADAGSQAFLSGDGRRIAIRSGGSTVAWLEVDEECVGVALRTGRVFCWTSESEGLTIFHANLDSGGKLQTSRVARANRAMVSSELEMPPAEPLQVWYPPGADSLSINGTRLPLNAIEADIELESVPAGASAQSTEYMRRGSSCWSWSESSGFFVGCDSERTPISTGSIQDFIVTPTLRNDCLYGLTGSLLDLDRSTVHRFCEQHASTAVPGAHYLDVDPEGQLWFLVRGEVFTGSFSGGFERVDVPC